MKRFTLFVLLVLAGCGSQPPTPQQPASPLEKGLKARAEGDLDAAVAAFSEALQQEKTETKALLERSQVYELQGKSEQALADLNRLLEIKGDHAEAYYRRGMLWSEQGERDKAVDDFSQAVKADPELVMAWIKQGVLLHETHQFPEALACYNQALKQQPEHVQALHLRANAQVDLFEYEKAVQDYRRVIELSPRDPQAYFDLAWVLALCSNEKIRDPQEALQLAQAGRKLASTDKWSHLETLAACYAAKGEFEKAVQWQQQALELADGISKIRCQQALEMYKLGLKQKL